MNTSSYVLFALLAPLIDGASAQVLSGDRCIDARQVSQARMIDASTVVLEMSDQRQHRLDLSERCQWDGGSITLVGPAGRLCGRPGEAVRIAGQSCAIHAMTPLPPIDPPKQAVTTLQPLQIQQQFQHGFLGNTQHCVGIRHIRNWSEDPQGVVVEVSPRRYGGNRYYRIELGSSCGDLSNAETLALISSMKLDRVCGNPGDHIQLSRSQPTLVAGMIDEGLARPIMQSPLATRLGCPISRVYPITRGP